MPGVLMIEALAQTAAIWAYKHTGLSPKKALFFLATVDKVRYRRMVVPGDQLRLQIDLKARRGIFTQVHGKAFVEDTLACSLDMMCARKDIED